MAVQKKPERPLDYGRTSTGITVFSPAFDAHYAYSGDDLGCSYSPQQTRFVLWAPTAEEAFVVLYDGDDDVAGHTIAMVREERGVWRAAVSGDLDDRQYNYRVKVGEQWNEGTDPYARAVSINGRRGVVIDLGRTNPAGWEQDQRPPFAHTQDAVIYELHVRDLTSHPLSGADHPGSYAAAAQTGTRGPDGIPTGLDHIASLGVTHVQLLPVFDYSEDSVDESDPRASYNWGYDPKNYNAPEGSYATDPYDPATRIRELKSLVQALHAKGLRVIMDVVYNHMYDAYRCNFTQLVPGYYFRYADPHGQELADGSGCGNETASERAMMRKFIVESVAYWAQEYHIDGFRFDLMGLHDLETMNAVRARLEQIDPHMLITGEGWIMGRTLLPELGANQRYAAVLPRIAQFNDGLRDALKGSIFSPAARGFISGQDGMEQGVKIGVAAAIPYAERIRGYADSPAQCLNFAECHDNHTLWDKLAISNPDEEDAARVRMQQLAAAIVLTAQGIPFLHAGQEFMRTKQGVENSYQSPDEINGLDWERCARYQAEVEEIRRLIALRKEHPAFRLRSAQAIRASLFFEDAPPLAIAYTLRNHAGGDPSQHLYVLYNGSRNRISLRLPQLGQWEALWCPYGQLTQDEHGQQLEASGSSCTIVHIR